MTAGLVIDASVSAGWFLEDQASAYTDVVLDRVAHAGARVPSLWPYEMANLLTTAARRGRLDEDRLAHIHAALAALPVHVDEIEPPSLMPSLVRIARTHRLSAYDAAYLELALRTGSSMATRDAALRAAAENAGVTVFAPDAAG